MAKCIKSINRSIRTTNEGNGKLVYLAHFFAGFFLINGLPHFIQGISGNWFQTPFATPLGIGESSPLTNVLWGFVNFVISYLLLFHIGDFEFGKDISTAIVFSSALLTAIALSWHFGKVRKDKS